MLRCAAVRCRSLPHVQLRRGGLSWHSIIISIWSPCFSRIENWIVVGKWWTTLLWESSSYFGGKHVSTGEWGNWRAIYLSTWTTFFVFSVHFSDLGLAVHFNLMWGHVRMSFKTSVRVPLCSFYMGPTVLSINFLNLLVMFLLSVCIYTYVYFLT